MAQEKIIIKFLPDGHEKLIKALNNLAKAQREVQNVVASQERANKKLNASAIKMGVALKQQGRSFKDLGLSTKIVTKAFKGHTASLEKMRLAYKKTEKTTTLMGAAGTRLTKGAGRGAKAFATWRNNLLLFNFALGMGIRQIAMFVKEATKVESMGMAFKTLSGGTENASIAMDRLKEATNGTMSRFDLFQQANNAMILGVSKNSEEMAEMFDIAQRLGQALGRDTRESVESLITGIGRQSRMMLDNIGIIVKSEEAYKAFADRLGITVEQLTEAQRKQAFLTATMESAREKVAGLNEELLTTQMRSERVAAAFKDASANVGQLAIAVLDLDNVLGRVAESTDNWNTILSNNIKDNKDWNNVIQGIVDLMIVLNPKLLMQAAYFKFNSENLKIFNEELATTTTLQQIVANFDPKIVDPMIFPTVEEDEIPFYLRPPDSNISEGWQRVLDILKQMNKVTKAGLDDTSSRIGATGQLLSSLSALSSANSTSAIQSMELAQMAAFASAIAGSMKAFEKGGVSGFITGTALLISGMARIQQINNQIAQAKAVPKAATGGLIGGRRHSQGGTMIEAEQGEFIMSRSAVDSVGVENLNRMNQGGGGSAITVNVSGNVLTQDFVEEELAEAIREAARRGTDFGIS